MSMMFYFFCFTDLGTTSTDRDTMKKRDKKNEGERRNDPEKSVRTITKSWNHFDGHSYKHSRHTLVVVKLMS